MTTTALPLPGPKRTGLPIFLTLLVLACLVLASLLPRLCLADDNRPRRVILVQGGEYQDYTAVMHGLIVALQQGGELAATTAPPRDLDMAHIWQWLVENPGKRLQFLEDGYYSADWDDKTRQQNKQRISQRLQHHEVDLIIALGTWAGVDLAPQSGTVPLLILSCSDAYGAGLMATPMDSGKDNIYVTVEPERYSRQLIFFHSLFQFKRLGIAYEDTPDGRSQASLDTLRKTAELLAVTLVPCTAPFDLPDPEQRRLNLLNCHQTLAPQIDAMYLSINSALEPKNIPSLLKAFTARNIPTFAQDAAGAVANGVLLDFAQANPSQEGAFAGQALLAILQGTPPRQAPNWLSTPIKISLNMDTARKIGWPPPFSLLRIVDTVYSKGSVYNRQEQTP